MNNKLAKIVKFLGACAILTASASLAFIFHVLFLQKTLLLRELDPAIAGMELMIFTLATIYALHHWFVTLEEAKHEFQRV